MEANRSFMFLCSMIEYRLPTKTGNIKCNYVDSFTLVEIIRIQNNFTLTIYDIDNFFLVMSMGVRKSISLGGGGSAHTHKYIS